MNAITKVKIANIEESLHRFARKLCPKYLDSTPCEDCDIECPFDQIDTLIRNIKLG